MPSSSLRSPFHLPFSRILHTDPSQLSPRTPPLVGPAVRLLLDHYGIKTTGLRASGPKKNILKGDVLSHISDKKLSPITAFEGKPAAQKHTNEVLSEQRPIIPRKSDQSEQNRPHVHVDIQLSEVRKAAVKRLMQSKNSIPQAYAFTHISVNKITELLDLVSRRTDFRLTLNDAVTKACSLALRSVPGLNVRWLDNSIRHISSVELSVALPSPNGLVTPVLIDADQLSLIQISDRLHELTARAGGGLLEPEELPQRGTFTLSSLGMFDSVSDFTAIISSPQAANLTIGGLKTHLGQNDATGKLTFISQFCATLCYDARTIDENTARWFLEAFKNLMTSPESLFAGMEYLFEDEAHITSTGEGLTTEDRIDFGKKDEELVKLLLK